jgi:hypothetical protein
MAWCTSRHDKPSCPRPQKLRGPSRNPPLRSSLGSLLQKVAPLEPLTSSLTQLLDIEGVHETQAIVRQLRNRSPSDPLALPIGLCFATLGVAPTSRAARASVPRRSAGPSLAHLDQSSDENHAEDSHVV